MVTEKTLSMRSGSVFLNADGKRQTQPAENEKRTPFKGFENNLCAKVSSLRRDEKKPITHCHLRDTDYQFLLHAMHQFVNQTKDYDAVLYEVVQFASHVYNANCQIHLFSDERDSLILSAIHDHNTEIFKERNLSLDDFTIPISDQGLGEKWLEENTPLLVQDIKTENEFTEIIQHFWPFEEQQPLSSLIIVPLYSNQEYKGVLVLIRYESDINQFSVEDLCFACHFARIVVDTIELSRNFQILHRQLSDQKKQISKLQSTEQRFRRVFESSTDAIFLCTKDGTIVDANTAALKNYDYFLDELIDQEISIISFDYLSLNFSADESDLSENDGEPFECLTRKKNGESIYTEVIIQPFSQGRKAFYQINTRDISERVQTQNKLKTQINRLHAIRAIDLVMKNGEELQSILDFILNQVKLELEVDGVILLLFNEEKKHLECVSAQGFKTQLENHYSPDIQTSFAGRIVQNRKMIYKSNMNEHEVNTFPKKLIGRKVKSYCGVPLLINEKVKGVIETFSRDKFDLNYDWINYLETLAGHAAIAIENYQLFTGLRQSNLDLLRAYDATIAGWSHALDMRDNETEGHTQRVTEMTVSLAREAGFSDEEIVHIRRGALLHDIGKIAIPDRILLKPGKLDADERIIMEKHPQYAYDMLSDIEYVKPALDIPLCHHEKWDGTGYPRGLQGEEIPFAARLFAVVDVWDALHSDRPYRRSLPIEEVYAYIKDNNGLHFDPQAVELFFKVVNTKKYNG